MPIYEYKCNLCQQKFSLLSRSITQPPSPVCPTCGGRETTRLLSSFAYHKSEKTRLEEVGEPQRFPSPDYYKDPRNIGRWAEKRLAELGVEMPSKVQEMIQAAREGELPEPVRELQPGLTEV